MIAREHGGRARRAWVRWMLCAMLAASAGVNQARAGGRSLDPNEVLPLAQVPPQHRESVSEVIREHTLHRKGKPETFPSNPRLYMTLLNDPVLTLGLWKDLGPTPAQLQQVGPNSYTGSDGAGANATWEYLVRTPRLHAMLCSLDYSGPRGNSRLNGRILLIVRSGFFREVNGEFWVQHDVEAYVKVDSRGWKAVAATARPIIEKILEDQLQEAGLFVSIMGRLVEMYPDWAVSVAAREPGLRPEARESFTKLVEETRRPGAFKGRPVVKDGSVQPASTGSQPLRR